MDITFSKKPDILWAAHWLLLVLLIIVPTSSLADDILNTRIIRADRLPATNIGEYSIIPARNPFAWPHEQLQIFEGEDGALKKDPFADFTLNAIIWTEKEPVAIINNKTLHRGDTIEGVWIRDIDKKSVTIENRRTSRKLLFPDPYIELKKSAEAD